MREGIIVDDLAKRYRLQEWNHAAAILFGDFPEQWARESLLSWRDNVDPVRCCGWLGLVRSLCIVLHTQLADGIIQTAAVVQRPLNISLPRLAPRLNETGKLGDSGGLLGNASCRS